jgi:hypothetical protein
MAIAAAPPLVEGMRARLDAGGAVPAGADARGGSSLACRVIGFSGGDVVLEFDEPPRHPLVAGDSAYLIVEAGGRMNALAGRVADLAGAELVLRLTDDIRLGQRRVFSRASLSLPTAVRRVDGDRMWNTRTLDVSAGGARLERSAIDVQEGDFLEVALTAGAYVLAATGRVMRATLSDVGVRFERIERDDRLLLAALALAYHRRAAG